jgi:hypothetical protein
MGIHRERLAASRAHKRCIAGMKQAARSMGLQVPGPSDISPKIIGAQPLPFPVPPMLEEALGYRGSLRFVGLFHTIEAFPRAPFTRLAAPSEPNRPEDLSALVASFCDVNAVLLQKLTASRSELHSPPALGLHLTTQDASKLFVMLRPPNLLV